ncbi:MAG: hypothetical protein ACFCUL_12290 [Flavobacteriaceae bacterium]
MKKLVFFTLFLNIMAVNAQNTVDYVPYDATMVGSISTKSLLNSITVDELDLTEKGQEVLENLSKKLGRKINTLNELGLDTQKEVYFYSRQNDSITYYTTVFPLTSTQFIEEMLRIDSVAATQQANFKYAWMENGGIMAWNANLLTITDGDYIDTYFTDYDFTALEEELKTMGEPVSERKVKSGAEFFGFAKPLEDTYFDEYKYEYEYYNYDIPALHAQGLKTYLEDYFQLAEEVRSYAYTDDASTLDSLALKARNITEAAKAMETLTRADINIMVRMLENKTRFVTEGFVYFTDEAVRAKAIALIDSARLTEADFIIDETITTEAVAAAEAAEWVVEDAAEIAASTAVEPGLYDIPYFSNYKLQEYTTSHYYFVESLKVAAQTNNTKQLDSLTQVLPQIKLQITEMDSVYAYDSLSVMTYLNKKMGYVAPNMTLFKQKTDQERAAELLDKATIRGNDLKMAIDPYAYDYDADSYKDYYLEKETLKNRWLLANIDATMAPASRSIKTRPNYAKQIKANSVANFWVSNELFMLSSLYTSAYSALGAGYNPFKNGHLNTMGDFSTNLFLEKEEAKITYDANLESSFGARYTRILDQKLNKKFLKYLNEDRMLAYITYNFSTKNALEEMPKMTAENLSYYFGETAKPEDVALVTDLIGIIIDEEAIGELIKGDMAFVLTGIGQKEVTYTDYSYDEDYNSTEIQKTKMETLPDFLYMASSDNVSFTNKLTSFLIRKDMVAQENGYYRVKISDNELGIPLYFLFKDGIFFLGTSAGEMQKIGSGTFDAKLSSATKKKMTQGNFSAYLNGKNLAQQMSTIDGLEREMGFLEYFQKYGTEISITSNKMKDNNLHSEMVMGVPEGSKNALVYIIDLFKNLAK